MAKLAIKGHPTRGKEVIEILEMLGGKNISKYDGKADGYVYTYNPAYSDNTIECLYAVSNAYRVFTLEEFLEKFPYKVGDKVLHKTYGIYSAIKTMKWSEEKEQVFYRLDSKSLFVTTADELKPRKEETMENKLGQITLDIPDGYEFFGINDDNKVVLTKIQPKYPKTYEECCKMLGYSGNYNMILTTDVDNKLFNALYRLKVCRDAYWKIAGNWKPDIIDGDLYCIGYNGNVITWEMQGGCRFLVFPTEEMRDAFYENFKDLIEECKELL